MHGEVAWHSLDSREALALALAARVSAALAAAVHARGAGFLAVSGGTTPALFFSALSRQDIDWARVVVTLVDERFVPADSERSNARLAMERLLQGRAAAARFVPLLQAGSSPAEAADTADETLAALPWPLDVVVLGMGTDGHTASFFPDAEGLDALLEPDASRIVASVMAASAGEPRLTLTVEPIALARLIVLHIEGAAKRATLEQALRPGSRLPIRRVIDAAAEPVQIYFAS